MKSKFFQNSGIISIYVLLLCMLGVTMGLTLIAIQYYSFEDSESGKAQIQARVLAQTALQEAQYYITKVSGSWSGTGPEMNVQDENGTVIGTYRYTVSKAQNIYNITAEGFVPNSSEKKKYLVTLNHKMRTPSPQIIFQDDFESGNLNAWASTSNDSGTAWDVATTDPRSGSKHGRVRRTTGGGGTKSAKLMTPVFNLDGYDQVIIRFSFREYVGGSAFRVYQNNTGNSGDWVQLFSDSGSSVDTDYGRPANRITVTNGSATTQFRFEGRFTSNNQSFFLDDVQISSPYAPYFASVDNKN